MSENNELLKKQSEIFEVLSAIDVTPYVQLLPSRKGSKDLKYLSWAAAIKLAKQKYPLMTWKVIEFDGKPYLYDEITENFTVYTEVTIEGLTLSEQLPVMNANNFPVKSQPYVITTKYSKYNVEKIDGMLVNKAIRRCLAKNLASFGLGLDLYIGDDLPFQEDDKSQTKADEPKAQVKPEVKQTEKKVTKRPESKPLSTQQVAEAQADNGIDKQRLAKVEKIKKAYNQAEITKMLQNKVLKYADGSLENLKDEHLDGMIKAIKKSTPANTGSASQTAVAQA